MSTAPSTPTSANLRVIKPQVHSAIFLAKSQDTSDFANAIPISAGTGAPSHTGVVGELYIRTDSTATIPALYRATTTALWEPVGGYSAATVAAATAITGTSSETDFDQTIVLPANLLTQGSTLKIRAQGIATATNSTDTLTAKLYIGSTAVMSTPAVDVANNDIFYFDFELVAREALGATAACVGTGTGGLGTPGTLTAKPVALASTTFATNAAITIKVSATWSTSSGSNSCRLDVLTAKVV